MISKIMLSYAFTFMMIEIADSSSMLIDGLIVSRHLGPQLLASYGLGNTSFQMISLFCSIFAIGIQSTCSAAMSVGDREKTQRYFTCGMIIFVSVALLATIFGYTCLDMLCHLFGADGSDPVLYDGLREFLRGWFVGIPGFIGFTVLCPLVTLDGNKRLVTIVTALESLLNIVGDYMSVAVWKIGIYGVGISTGLAFDIAAVILVLNFFRKRSVFRIRFGGVKFSMAAEMSKIGLPRLTKYGCKLVAPILINRTILAIGGSSAMAAMSVKASIGAFCLVAGNGIAESTNLLSQVFYSEKDKKSLFAAAQSAMKLDIIVCTVFAAVLFLLANVFAGLYLPPDTFEYSLAVIMLRCLALSIALNGTNAIILNYLQGTRKIIAAHLQTVSHRLVFLALSTFVLGKLFGVTGLFAAIPVSELLVTLTYVTIALVKGNGKNRLDALLLIPDDFGCAEEDSLAFSVSTLDGVVGISEKISEFCTSRGIDRRRAYFTSLCLEEMAGNVVEHGFKKDKKKHSCDIRVMIEDGDVVLRIRDDCPYFNIKERYNAMVQKDELSNIGIRLVYGIAKDVRYVNLLNTNTLIIRV